MITPNIIERSWIQGATVAVEYLTGTAFSGENGAHTFRITGKDAEGQPVAVSGTVLAKILRADNITVDVSGSVVDGVAEVTMVGDCYNVPGRTSLVIFLSDGTNTVTLYAAIFNVFRSTSGEEIDSGVSIPTLTELLAQIERMETATAAAEAATNRAEHLLETSETTAWNQIVPNGNFASTSGWQKYSGHSFAVANNELTLTVNSTSTRSRIYREDLVITGDHKYYVHGEMKASQNAQPLFIRLGGVDITKSGYETDTWYLLDGVITAVDDGSTVTLAYGADQSHRLSTGESFSARNVWATDLTAIYGEGLEPTAEEFRQAYPHRYYDYAAIGSVRNLDITEVHGQQITELSERMDSAEDVIDALESNKADKADLAYTDDRLDVLWKLTHGVAWDTVADNADGYAKAVPQGVHMTEVGMWGGKSVVWNQLISTQIDYTNTNTDTKDVLQLVVRFGSSITSTIAFVDVFSGASDYYRIVTPTSDYTGIYIMHNGSSRNLEIYKDSSFTWKANHHYLFHINILSADVTTVGGVHCKNAYINDLTLMFGAGNEPTTTDDPRIAAIEAYAAEHPEYNAGEIVNADVVSIDTHGRNLIDDSWCYEGAVGGGTRITSFDHKQNGFIPSVTYSSPIWAFKIEKNKTYYIKDDGISPNADGLLRYAIYPTLESANNVSNIIASGNVNRGIGMSFDEDAVCIIGVYTQGTTSNPITWNYVYVYEDGHGEYKPYHLTIHPIPSSVLAAYPLRSAGNVYDTISWDGSKWWHSKRVGSVDLGTKNWSKTGSTGFWVGISDASKNTHYDRCMCALYTAVNKGTLSMLTDKECSIDSVGNLQVRDSSYENSTAAEFKAAMDGVILYYELATEVVTDITDLMEGWHGELPTEGGGTITFAQQDGTVFPVPNHLTHYRNLSEVN